MAPSYFIELTASECQAHQQGEGFGTMLGLRLDNERSGPACEDHCSGRIDHGLS